MSEHVITDEAWLIDALEVMNDEGTDPLLPGHDRRGVAFLASLDDQGDTAELVYTTQGDDDGWRPEFPVTVWSLDAMRLPVRACPLSEVHEPHGLVGAVSSWCPGRSVRAEGTES